MKKANFWIISGVLIIDWLSKYYAVKKNISFLYINPDSLFFGLVRLPGFLDSLVVAILLIIFIWFYFQYWRSEKTLNAFSLIVGGAAANLIDGILDGSVTDFINVGISTLNVADFAIMGGIAILLMQNLKRKA